MELNTVKEVYILQDKSLHNYKEYLLSYLDKKFEALEILRELIKSEPEKGIYQDIYGEILRTYKEYEKAIEEF